MESATFNFNCPHCGQQISATAAQAGTPMECPSCGRSFSVPVAAPTAATPGRNPLLIPVLLLSLLVIAVSTAGLILMLGRGQEPKSATGAAAAALSPAGGSEAKSAVPTSFDAVAAHLDRGGSFYLYLDTAQWLAGLSKQIDSIRDMALTLGSPQDAASLDSEKLGFAVVSDLVKNSGVEEIAAVGASSIAVEPGVYVNKLFVHHHEGKGNGFIWSTFGKAPHHLDALDFLPVDTALANSSDLDLGNLLAGVREELTKTGIPNAGQAMDTTLAQLSATMGLSVEDLLKSLGGSAGLVLTLNPAKPISIPVEGQTLKMPTPRVAIFLRVKDDRLFSQIDKMVGAIPTVIRHDDADLRTRGVPVPGPMEAWLHPTVAQWSQGYLVLATDETLIRDMVAAQKTGQGLKSTPQFAGLFSGLPQEGNAFQIATPQFGETWAILMREALKNQPGTTPDQQAMMQKLFGQQTTGAMSSVSAFLADGLMVVGKGNQGASRMLGPLIVAPVAFAAGVALPVFGEVQKKGKATKSLSNAKQLATACKLYAVDNSGKFPPTLQALVPDYLASPAIFASPFRPEVPMGYDYKAGLTDTSAAGLVLIEDKFAPEVGHVRVVSHVDTSAEVIKLPKATVP